MPEIPDDVDLPGCGGKVTRFLLACLLAILPKT